MCVGAEVAQIEVWFRSATILHLICETTPPAGQTEPFTLWIKSKFEQFLLFSYSVFQWFTELMGMPWFPWFHSWIHHPPFSFNFFLLYILVVLWDKSIISSAWQDNIQSASRHTTSQAGEWKFFSQKSFHNIKIKLFWYGTKWCVHTAWERERYRER